MLCNADQDVTREHEYLTELIRRSVDGFVIASSEISIKRLMKRYVRKDSVYCT